MDRKIAISALPFQMSRGGWWASIKNAAIKVRCALLFLRRLTCFSDRARRAPLLLQTQLFRGQASRRLIALRPGREYNPTFLYEIYLQPNNVLISAAVSAAWRLRFK